MKLLSLLIIAAISFSLLASPGNVQLFPDENGMTAFTTLDICHHADSGILPVLDMPGIHEFVLPAHHTSAFVTSGVISIPIHPFLFDIRDELPPKA